VGVTLVGTTWDIIWDGITRSATLNDWAAEARRKLAEAAKGYQWPEVIALLQEHPEFVNPTSPPEGSRQGESITIRGSILPFFLDLGSFNLSVKAAQILLNPRCHTSLLICHLPCTSAIAKGSVVGALGAAPPGEDETQQKVTDDLVAVPVPAQEGSGKRTPR
jgi:hypothetical protein